MLNPFRARSTDALTSRARTLVRDAEAVAAREAGQKAATMKLMSTVVDTLATRIEAHEAEEARALAIRERISNALI
jgi:hypothetical protein